MAVRRRYYYWLVKAYIKKWRAVIFTSILAGIVGFFLFFGILQLYIQPLLSKQTQVIGYEGIVTPATIPEPILEDISFGLTKVDKNGKILPAASSSWEIRNNGKQYIFHLKKGLKFHNGDELTADNVPLEFKEAKVKKIDKYTVVYELDEVYAPFLSAVSKPLLLDNFEGLGEYKFSDVGINGGFIKELELVSVDDKRKKKKIFFYPSQDALKTAFVLGDVDKAIGVKDTIFNSSDLRNWKGKKKRISSMKNALSMKLKFCF
jgi:peptide/nickel transport system substrate-binding protein